ncbi:hypothetical protein DFJ74DRAFT_714433 [Hyaloraphidium curvatum]|nr:hypothetical protein DFJ74DRAFT_714433 [Hyaloraphidium curvatum]
MRSVFFHTVLLAAARVFPLPLRHPALRALSSLPTKPPTKLVYEGPASKPLRTLKRVSVTTLGVSWGIAPLMALLDFTQISPAFVAALVGSALFTSTASTLLIYLFTKPYVVKLYHHGPAPSGDGPLVTLTTLDLMGNPVHTTLPAGRLAPSTRPFTTYAVLPGTKPWPQAQRDPAHAAFLNSFLPVGEIPRGPYKARDRFYMLEDRGAGNEAEGAGEEFGQIVGAASRPKKGVE